VTTCRYINSSKSNFEFEYIGEFKTEFLKFLEYESGAQVGSNNRKKQRAKFSCYYPFNIRELYYLQIKLLFDDPPPPSMFTFILAAVQYVPSVHFAVIEVWVGRGEGCRL
jgi:hypothetical protein